MKKILFICTGNICRSPAAEAISRLKAKELGLDEDFLFDSAGTDSYHAGEFPDSRIVEAGKWRGISFDGILARQITQSDFDKFDYLMCMDRSHYKKIMQLSKVRNQEKVKLFLQFCESPNPWNDEVKDPYYKGNEAFEEVFDVLEMAVDAMFKKTYVSK